MKIEIGKEYVEKIMPLQQINQTCGALVAGNDVKAGLLLGLILTSTESINPENILMRVSITGRSLPIDATVAAACLLQPATGDLVLLCQASQQGGAEDGGWWVLSVLQRGQPTAQARLGVSGADSLLLQAPSISLLAQHQLSVATGDLTVNAGRTSLHTHALQLVASTAHVVARQLTRVVHVFHALADTVTEHCRTKVVLVDEVHSTQAGTELLESTDAMLLKSGQVLVDAKQTVRIDGQHILMG